MMDAKEAKKQILFAVPIILTNIFYNLIPTVSIMFTGHLGELELASSTLAQSWATVTGYSFMIGLSGALETLCGQGFGAKLYNMLGIYLQASCIVSFIFSIAISLLWWYTEPILISLHQNPDIAKQSAIYMRFLIPGIFAYGILQNILRFFQTQSVVLPIVLFSLFPLLLHIAFTNLLVHHTSLGFHGAALATSLTFWFSVLILMVYVSFAKTFRRTWTGLSFITFSYVFTNFNLALYSASMLCLEYWAFEILVILAGIMPNSEETTSLVAMCVYTEAIAFMVTYGMSAAASTRVSNELGEGNTKQAKHAMNVSLKLSTLLASIVLIGLAFGRHIWPSLFSNIPTIIKAFASMTPLLCCSIFLDAIQGVLSGACRGCGWQQLATYINLATFYLIGMPIACLLAFKLQYGVKGLWFGLVCGLLTQSFLLYMITLLKDWTVIATPHEYSDSDLDKNEEGYKPGLT